MDVFCAAEIQDNRKRIIQDSLVRWQQNSKQNDFNANLEL